MNWNTAFALVALPLLGGPACAPPLDEVALPTTHELGGPRPPDPPEKKCPDWMCNAATVGDGLVFDELAFDRGLRRPNVANIWVSRVELGGRPVQLQVRGHEVTVDDGGKQIVGADLKGLLLVLEHGNGARYELRFEWLLRTEFWGGPTGYVPYHLIRVRKVRQGTELGRLVGREPDAAFKRSLCAGTPDPEEGKEVTEMAVIFEGDRYDAYRKTVTEVPSGGPWFNVACAGTAMIKTHLLRHTRSGSPITSSVGPATNPLQRQAMLKTLTADYCGDGVPHTVNGHPLLYADAGGLFPRSPLDLEGLLKKGATLEAIWGPDGAVCLDNPRYAPLTSIDCGPRVLSRCGSLANWQQRGHVVSLNPPPKQL